MSSIATGTLSSEKSDICRCVRNVGGGHCTGAAIRDILVIGVAICDILVIGVAIRDILVIGVAICDILVIGVAIRDILVLGLADLRGGTGAPGAAVGRTPC